MQNDRGLHEFLTPNDATKYRWRHAEARVSRKTYNRRSRYIQALSCTDNVKR